MADDRLTICLNLGRMAPGQFGGYNFKSMCKFGDKLLGANEDGLFVLNSGDTDNGTDIPAFFVIGPTDFGAEEEKRIRRLYFSGRMDGRLRVEMSGDEEDPVSQELNPENIELRLTHHRIKGGRDVRGKYLKLKVSNVLGSDFTVSSINAVLVVLGQNATEGV
jgi:hypothetical protein